jgi:hypothetical protein
MARPLVSAGKIPKLKLTYFNIQGAAEKVRLAFVLGAVPFDDVRVPFPEWPALKPTTPYGQLPLLTIDDGEPMAQSDAMLCSVTRVCWHKPTAFFCTRLPICWS